MKRYLFILVYILLSVLVFAVFMGVTIGNFLFNLTVAFILSKKQFINNIQYRTLSFIMLLGANVASAYIALKDIYTSANLEGMLGLNFHLTQPMICAIIIIGGILILYVNDILVRKLYK